jgi:molecular chaperone GrpE (heat shock protein)
MADWKNPAQDPLCKAVLDLLWGYSIDTKQEKQVTSLFESFGKWFDADKKRKMHVYSRIKEVLGAVQGQTSAPETPIVPRGSNVSPSQTPDKRAGDKSLQPTVSARSETETRLVSKERKHTPPPPLGTQKAKDATTTTNKGLINQPPTSSQPPPATTSASGSADSKSESIQEKDRGGVISKTSEDGLIMVKIIASDKVLSFIESKKEEESAEHSKEMEEFEQQKTQFEKWVDVTSRLLPGIKDMESRWTECVEKKNSSFDSELPSELQKAFLNRREGIQLALKMLSRLPDKLSSLKSTAAKTFESPSPCDFQLLLLELEKEEELGEEQTISYVENKCKEIRHRNYQRITAIRESAEDLRKGFFNFMEKQFFVILDGLEDGKKNSLDLKTSLLSSYEPQKELIEDWFRLYDELIAMANEFLAQFKISPIVAQKGESVNYEQHEPFDVEPDETLQDEQVKEMIRKGYEYGEKLFSEKNYVIRSAQVVVVKNK